MPKCLPAVHCLQFCLIQTKPVYNCCAAFIAISIKSVSLYARRGLSLELSLAIVFFTNIVLSLGALIYIVTGINTDLFLWARDYIISLKDEDSAVNAKVCLAACSAAADWVWVFRAL